MGKRHIIMLQVYGALWFSVFISLAFVAGSALDGFASPAVVNPALSALPVPHTALRTWSLFVITLVLSTWTARPVNEAQRQAARGNRVFLIVAALISAGHLGLAIGELVLGNDTLTTTRPGLVIAAIVALGLDLVTMGYVIYQMFRRKIGSVVQQRRK